MKFDLERMAKITGELARRQAEMRTEEAERKAREEREVATRDYGLLDDIHPKALAFVRSTALQKVAKTTRRSGKTRNVIRGLADRAMRIPNSYHAYVNTTFRECENYFWIGNRRDGLMSLNVDFGLGGQAVGSKLRMTFPNGSRIECLAADDEKDIQKFRSAAFDTLVIDEAQKMPHLERIIVEEVGPAMLDHMGQTWLTGTPSRQLNTLFHRISCDEVEKRLTEWDLHEWTILDNPFFGATVEERYERMMIAIRKTGKAIDDPAIQREWFGKWSKEDANFVYAVHEVPDHQLIWAEEQPTLEPFDLWVNNHCTEIEDFPDLERCMAELPQGHDWFFTLGIDIGFHPSPFAFDVSAYSFTHPEMLEVAGWKMTKLVPDEQMELLNRIVATVNPTWVTADAGGGGKLVVAGWAKNWLERYSVPIEEAKKRDKVQWQELMNGDIRTGKYRMRRNSPRLAEMEVLTYHPPTAAGTLKENTGTAENRIPNDCCDAGLYGFRHSYHHRYQSPEDTPKPGTSEYYAMIERELEEAAIREVEEQEEFELYGYD